MDKFIPKTTPSKSPETHCDCYTRDGSERCQNKSSTTHENCLTEKSTAVEYFSHLNNNNLSYINHRLQN